ncbi:MAG: tetratricopeptide repeat protein, partial [Acidobacteriota bacterium]
ELTDRPVVQARLLLTISNVYHQLSLYQESAELAAESAALRETAGATPRDIGEARLTEASSLAMIGQLDEASERLDRIEESLGEEARSLPRITTTRGLIAFSRGHFEDAAGFFRGGIDLELLQQEPDYSVIARSSSNLGFAYEQLGRPEEAEAAYLESLDLARRHLGADDPAVASALNNLGACMKDQGKVESARDYYSRALDLRSRILGQDHLQTAQTRANLAILDAEAGRWRQAIPEFTRTIEAFTKHLGAEHPHVGMAWNNLGQCHRQLGEHDLARNALDRGLEAITSSVGAEHPIAAQNLLQQAALLFDTGRIGPGEEFVERVAPILDGSIGDGHWLFSGLAKARCRAAVLQRSTDAVEICGAALTVNRETYGDIHRSSLGTAADLATALLESGRT